MFTSRSPALRAVVVGCHSYIEPTPWLNNFQCWMAPHLSVQPSLWLGIHSYRLSSSTALQKPPTPSCLSCLSYSLPSAPCLHVHACHSWTASATQHVKGPAHVKGHTLGLVCPTGTAPSHLQCLDLAVSDHYAGLFTVHVPVPKQRISRNISYRNIKTVNTLAVYLQRSWLPCPSWNPDCLIYPFCLLVHLWTPYPKDYWSPPGEALQKIWPHCPPWSLQRPC